MPDNIHIDNGSLIINAAIDSKRAFDSNTPLTEVQQQNLQFLRSVVDEFPRRFMRITKSAEDETTLLLCSFEPPESGNKSLVVANEDGVFILENGSSNPYDMVLPQDIAAVPDTYVKQLRLAVENNGVFQPKDKGAFPITIKKVEPGKPTEKVMRDILGSYSK